MNVIDVLGQLRKGRFAEQFQEELRHLVDAVRDTGRKGTITVSLTVGLAGKEDQVLEIQDKISVKVPQPERGSTIMFATADGDLTRRDPRQHDIEDSIREVKTA